MRRLVALLAVALAAVGAPVAALALTGPTEIPEGTKAALRLELDDEDPSGRITGSGFSCTLAVSEQTADFSGEEDRETGCQQFYESASGSAIRLTAVPSGGFAVAAWRGSMPACNLEPGEGVAAPRSITIPRAQLKLVAGLDTPSCEVDFERLAGGPPPDPCLNARPGQPRRLAGVCPADPVCPEGAIRGTDDGETIEGTPGNDVICGLGGDDTILGRGGDDELYGGDGDDTLSGGLGSDRLFAGPSADGVNVLLGGPEIDVLQGGTGTSILFGGDGGDYLFSGEGGDGLGSFGCDGGDTLIGSDVTNRLNGDSAAIDAEEALLAIDITLPDTPPSELGCDPADVGNDGIDGAGGNDVISGGPGIDTILGGANDDEIDGDMFDNRPLPAGLPQGITHGDSIDAGPGSDTVHGGPGNDDLFGGRGPDDLFGDAGDDELDGEGGDDRQLRGGPGSDTIDGGPGRDKLVGGQRKDVMRGQGGDDRIEARDGVRDVTDGGPGTDTGQFDGVDVRTSIEGAAVLP